MTDVKWIKLSTQMFEDDKIRLIESMPEADTVLIIWIKLLSQAGKTNAGGYIYLNENIPYTDEMLSTIFNRPLNTVRMALQTFQTFGMIEITDDNFIGISNWEKHQNIDGLEKIREQTKKRVTNYRQRQKESLKNLPEGDVTLRNVSGNEEVTSGNETELELELELELEKEKELKKEINIPYGEVINYLNYKAGTKYRHTTQKTKDLIKAKFKEKYELADFKTVIDKKTDEWLHTDNAKYLRPETLFGTKFEGYLNQLSTKGGKVDEKTRAAREYAEKNELPF